jgi:hypothetical protein
MVAVHQHALATRGGACDAHGDSEHVRAVLAEGDPFGARDTIAQALRQFDLFRVQEGEERPAFDLGVQRAFDVGIAVAEDHRSPAHDPVDVVVAGRVDQMRAFAAFGHHREDARRIRVGSVPDPPGAGGQHVLGAVPPRLRAGDCGRIRIGEHGSQQRTGTSPRWRAASLSCRTNPCRAVEEGDG